MSGHDDDTPNGATPDGEGQGTPPEPTPKRADDAPPPGLEARREALRRKRETEAKARLDAEIAEVEAYRMPLMDHLVELKNRVLWSLGALVIGCAVGLYYGRDLYEVLAAPMIGALVEAGLDEQGFALRKPFEGIMTYFKVSLIGGMLLASPVVSHQIWQFVAPGLYRSEKRLVLPLSISSTLLFLAGSAFCFWGLLPFAFPVMITTLDVAVQLSPEDYVSAIFRMMLAFGVCFQLPVVAFFLARAGLIDAKDMRDSFKYAVVGIFVMAALITPPDPMTQVLLATPMVLLYGVGIGVAAVSSTKQRDADGNPLPPSFGPDPDEVEGDAA